MSEKNHRPTNPRELRQITKSPDYLAKIAAAEEYEPDDHERHKAAQIMYRDLRNNKAVNAGNGTAVRLCDVLNTPEGFNALFKFYQGRADREDISDIVIKWCLERATAVIRSELVQEIDEKALEDQQERAA